MNEFLKSKKLIPEQVLFLAYGSVLDHLNREAVVEFAQTLAEVNEIGVWVALSIMSFYCHRNDERFFENADIFKSLTLNASLQEEITKSSAADLFVWKEKVLKLLLNDFDFSSNICVHTLTQSKGKISFGALWDDVKPVFTEIMKAHGDHLWDNIGEQIVNSDPRERYRLQNLLEKKDSFSTKSPSPLNFIPSEKIIEWCKNHPEVGPKFIAKSINVFEEAEEELQPSTLFVKFMCVFGDSDEVKSYVSANMYSRSYTNLLVPTLLREREALSVLLEHENAKVKSWARETIDSIDSEIERNKLHDE